MNRFSTSTLFRVLLWILLLTTAGTARADSFAEWKGTKVGRLLQKGDRFITEQKWKHLDTTYIKPEKYGWSIYLNTYDGAIRTRADINNVQLNTLSHFGINAPMDIHMKMRTGTSERIGLSVGYRGLLIAYSIDIGNHCSKDFTLRSYGKQFGGDIRFHTTTNMHGTLSSSFDKTHMKVEVESLIDRIYNNNNKQIPREQIGQNIADTLMKVGVLDKQNGEYKAKPMELKEGETKVTAIVGNGYYCANRKHFSYPAALSNEFRQLRSAGSFIATLAFMHLNMKAESEKMKMITGGVEGMKLTQVAAGAGYGYNLVACHSRLLLHASGTAGILFVNRNRISLADNDKGDILDDSELIDRMERNAVNPIAVLRLGAKYRFSDHWFVGSQGLVNRFKVGKQKNYTMRTTDWLARLYLTYRF